MRLRNKLWSYTFHEARSLGIPYMYWRHYNGRCRHVLSDDGLVVPVRHWGRLRAGMAGRLWVRTNLGAFLPHERMRDDPDRHPFNFHREGHSKTRGKVRIKRFVWLMLTNGFDYVAAYSAIYTGEKTGKDLQSIAWNFCRKENVMSEIQGHVNQQMKAQGVDVEYMAEKYKALVERLDEKEKDKLLIEALKMGSGWLGMNNDKKGAVDPGGLMGVLGGALERLGAGGHRPALGSPESGRMVEQPDPVRDGPVSSSS